jgi:hypothetical protein
MRRPAACVLLGLVLIAAAVPCARAQITADAVREAIQRGAAFLKRQQAPGGNWPDSFDLVHHGGMSALCTLALLNSGVDPEDDSIQRALTYLRAIKPRSTYVVSLQIMVLCRAEPETGRLRIAQLVRFLEENQIKRGERRGSWAYPQGSGDNSNSQFALLALHEAERIGVRVNPQTWRLARDYWERCQNRDGSWGYRPGDAGTGSMTCAGITSLVIANDKIGAADAKVEDGAIKCCQRGEAHDEPVQRGLNWLGNHFAVTGNPGRGQFWQFYYLYGLERTGRLTSHRFIGGHDWYREGAEELLRLKGGPLTDRWRGRGREDAFEDNECLATSFALLFLSKGRWPVLVSKLKHGRWEDWERHRHDVGNLTRYVELKWKRDLVWQVIDMNRPPAKDESIIDSLVQSPVLYLCGSESPLPDDPKAQEELARNLRGYLDRGGFLLAEGYCGGAAFDDGFRKLMAKVFPEPEYRLQKLDPGHPIWRAEEPIAPESLQYLPPLLGIEFGCRTSVVYAPDAGEAQRHSLSCLWELSRPGRETRYAPSVQKQIDAGLSLGINILAYATNRELQNKEAVFDRIKAMLPGAESGRARLYVPSLRHPGGCNAAPRALANLLQAAAENLKLRVSIEPREVSATDPALFDYHLVFVHGRNAFSFTAEERKQLRTFLQRGGTIFANAICASKPFADSLRREMRAIWPEQPLRPIPKNDPLLSVAFGGFDLSTVSRRDPQVAGANQPLRAIVRKVAPELEGIRINEHYGVIFSPYDLSCALEKQDTMECQGYTRQDAARIGLNVILYSLQQ